MKLIYLTLLVIIPFYASAGEQRVMVPDLTLKSCELKDVIAKMQHESILRSTEVNESYRFLLNQLKKFNSKATIPGKPIINQLSSNDHQKYIEINQRLKITTFSKIIEGIRQRDIKVIQKMVLLADRDYRHHLKPSEEDPDFSIYSTLRLLRLMIRENIISTPNSAICTIQYALHSIQKEAIDRLNLEKLQLSSSLTELKPILDKYGLDNVDRSKLSEVDVNKTDKLLDRVLGSMKRHSDFIQDIERIKIMALASDIVYESNKQDIAISGSNPQKLGRTIQRRINRNEFNTNTLIAIGLWAKINEKYFNNFIKQLDQNLKIMRNRI